MVIKFNAIKVRTEDITPSVIDTPIVADTPVDIFNRAKSASDEELVEITGQLIWSENITYVKKMFDNFNLDLNSINAFDFSGAPVGNKVSFLWLAALTGSLPIVSYLLSLGANPNLKTSQGNQILHDLITVENRGKIIDALITAGADLNTLSKKGLTLPVIALFANEKNFKTAFKILDAGADVDKKFYNKSKIRGLLNDGTLLIYCIYEDRPAMVKTILGTYQANPNIPTSESIFPIHYAIMGESPDMLKNLIDAGADVNEQDIDGLTPLHYAAFYGDEDLVKQLIDAGAYNDLEDSDGLVALDYAKNRGKKNVYKYLNPDDARMESRQGINEAVIVRLESRNRVSSRMEAGIGDRLKAAGKKLGSAALELGAAMGPVGSLVKTGAKIGREILPTGGEKKSTSHQRQLTPKDIKTTVLKLIDSLEEDDLETIDGFLKTRKPLKKNEFQTIDKKIKSVLDKLLTSPQTYTREWTRQRQGQI